MRPFANRQLPWALIAALPLGITSCKKELVEAPSRVARARAGNPSRCGYELPNPIVVRLLDVAGAPVPTSPWFGGVWAGR
jgi:hypothetical protein